jgi:methionyl-tRNA synthetase
VDNLKTILAPILPHTAQRLHEFLGYQGQIFGTQHVVEYRDEAKTYQALTQDHHGAVRAWTPSRLPPGQPLRKVGPLFKKLDESLVDEQYARLDAWFDMERRRR